MNKTDFYTINDLANLFDISSRTIRYYEEVGLLSSNERDSLTKRRVYPDSERRRLKLILRGKKLGFSLQEIKEMIHLYEANPDGKKEKQRILSYADKKITEIEEQISQLQMLKADIISHINKYK